ncbi:CoA-acylating methylmalonate-semialdehyde dehydrogenase [Pseudomonas otitidis]|uniref:methylmalonate-semialdehyde dehydrogenase (CoA acylating) n=1 Tax=Metapseudomonas otitidis TaxID=319939 RepID=A0A1I0UFA3_9GAMM|nr:MULTISPECIES: CoA-acylating methylmalonate-semialdehyde dehydrogenase [Pseudomonas]MDL5597166.1 CoA-acylating methylmalonate-semialdehyde dehydrogenase [Bacillus subtilis]KIV71096.1 Methylmalonate-semialdehyde dehydrogenase [Pseudomonas sp. FeS53a]MCO7555730.1 CoA-acylating methylmalonate-semialdehyde dehydrogenase [Pseudomonas otitidis]MDG9780529.1 CoA-acylating methylmalonate-semialdehyde dehydrogenase [Pseudomonas otitidis]MDH0338350.1 CoA-acylating methylmalonate-semialdehyde dehydrogen
MSRTIPQLIDGQWRESRARELIEVTDPATQAVLALAPRATAEEIEAAVASARDAFLTWREVPVPERARLMLRYQHLLKEHHDELAELLASETGKTFADAKGDVWRGIEVAEHAANVASLMMGETVENVAREIDTASWIQPLGVCVGITPFNFPAMIPLWMFPLAIACGNTFILKPSEQDPLTPNRLAELFLEAGAPKGVLQVLHGGREQVDALLTHPEVRAISFVGSVPVGQHVYRTGTAHMKRVQAFAGAKNHMVILPDANKEQTLSNLIGASCGAAGQRCMAISVAVFVGQAREWIGELAEQMAQLRPGHWSDPQAAYGPLISQQARQRVLRLIAEGKAEGAECLLDGSHCEVPGYPDGNWLGPTLFRGVTPRMGLYREEIFGPVLACVEVDTLDEAIALVNASPYGNGTSLFTRSGGAARHFQHAVEVGQVGINVPIPVPLPFFSFTGWKGSFYGDLHAYGKQAVRFYTETKTVTTRWFDDSPVSGPNMTIQLK